jgi:hypothetical protein
MLKLQARAKLCTLRLYLFGVFYNSEITQTLFKKLERSAIMPFWRCIDNAGPLIALEFSLYDCTLHSLAKGPV